MKTESQTCTYFLIPIGHHVAGKTCGRKATHAVCGVRWSVQFSCQRHTKNWGFGCELIPIREYTVREIMES